MLPLSLAMLRHPWRSEARVLLGIKQTSTEPGGVPLGPTLLQPRHYFPDKGSFVALDDFGAEETMIWLALFYGSSFAHRAAGRCR